MINRQFDRYLRHTDRTHHAVAGIQQRLILTIFGCQRILAGGMRAARRTGERVFGLSKNGLIRSGNLPVISFRRSECLLGLRIRPTLNMLRGRIGRLRRAQRGPPLQHVGESGDIDCGNHQRDHKRIPCMQLPAQPALTRLTRRNVNHLIKRQRTPRFGFGHTAPPTGSRLVGHYAHQA